MSEDKSLDAESAALAEIQKIKVKVSDFVRFLDTRKEGKIVCEVCDGVKWVYHSESVFKEKQQNDLDELIVPFELSLVESSSFLPVAIFHCESCGNIKYLNYILLKKWVDAHPEVPEASKED